mmetsp:Transcript_4343/g.6476  ORF Transcript_4343/g.6476 Transcript_4343/m.6476 type:complete len:365 (-) Transcript_4343:501-1595(-)
MAVRSSLLALLSLCAGGINLAHTQPIHTTTSHDREALIAATVHAKVVYPSYGQARAIVVVAHCTMCWGDWYPHLAELADDQKLLFVFVNSSPIDSVLHFTDLSNGAPHTWFSGYAKDLSQVLRDIRNLTANDESSQLYGKLESDAPALAMGHSLGGAGGLIATSEDEAFDAAFVLSPCMIHTEDLSAITKPIFVLSATFDGICPPRLVGRPYYDALVRAPTVLYAELVGGTHCNFMDVSGTDWELGASLGIPEIANGACSGVERVIGGLMGEPLTQDYWLDHQEQLALTVRYVGLFLDAALFGNRTYVSVLEELQQDEEAGILSNVQASLEPRDDNPLAGRPNGYQSPITSQKYLALTYESFCS